LGPVESKHAHRLAQDDQAFNLSPTRELAPVEHAPLPVNCCELRCGTADFITNFADLGIIGSCPGLAEIRYASS